MAEESANFRTDDNGEFLPMIAGLTKEKLEARKQEAEKAKEQAFATIHHWYGVIADCDYWLAELDKGEGAGQNKLPPKL